MSDLTARAYRIAWERLGSANDPRIAAAWGLVQAWEERAESCRADAAALERSEENTLPRVALFAEAQTVSTDAAELCRVLDGDSPGGAS